MVDTTQVQQFQEQLMQFIRGLGLHRPDATPCDFPVSLAEACAMVALSKYEPLAQRDLGDALNLEKSTVSRLVVDLMQRGWLARERDVYDGRIQRLRRTATGIDATAQIVQARNTRFGELVQRVDPVRRQQVVEAMTLLAEVVSNDVVAADH